MDKGPPGTTPVFQPALEALARSWNRLDPGLLLPWLDEDVCYLSPATELHLSGRQAVMDYLERKAGQIEAVGDEARIRAELGWVPTFGGVGRPCVISSQGGVERAALFLVTLTAEGRIGRIEVSTGDADRRHAEGSGVVPW